MDVKDLIQTILILTNLLKAPFVTIAVIGCLSLCFVIFYLQKNYVNCCPIRYLKIQKMAIQTITLQLRKYYHVFKIALDLMVSIPWYHTWMMANFETLEYFDSLCNHRGDRIFYFARHIRMRNQEGIVLRDICIYAVIVMSQADYYFFIYHF